MKKRSFTFIGFIIFGLIFVAGSIFIMTRPKIEYKTCEGTVVNIEEYYDTFDGDNQLCHRVYVDYTVDGKEYKNAEYGSYNSSMKEGDKVAVYYDPSDPSSIQPEGFETVPYVVLGAGCVAIIVGVIGIIGKKQ